MTRYDFESAGDGKMTYTKRDVCSAAFVELPTVSPNVSCSKVYNRENFFLHPLH